MHRCKALILCAALFCSAPARAAYTFVQNATPVDATGVTTRTISLAGVTVGDLLELVAVSNKSGTPTTVSEGSDTVNTVKAWTLTQGSAYVGIYYAIAGSTSVTWTFTIPVSGEISLFAYEWSGNVSTSTLDQTSPWATATSTTVSTSTLTPAGSGELALAVLSKNNNALPTWSGSYVARDNLRTGNYNIFIADQVISGTTATAAAPSWTGSTGSAVVEAFFVPSAGGGSCTHTGWTSAGTFAIPNAGSTNVWRGTGTFSTVDCSSQSYWQSGGSFGTN